ncbi:tetratricopeptide repeat protein [Marinicellulosiphila megalodicopiae]|uniref:tetratricopeptide repeat protein n=1 Tax=Marinicellulosiphila megalodicopiae TaxID=2724896 RepID=UPI003BB1591C
MNKFIVMSFCCVLSVTLAGCYAPVNKSGGKALVYETPRSESQKAADNYIALAFQYINAGQLGTARSKLDQAKNFDSTNPKAYLGYALIYDQEQETRLAEENFNKAAAHGGGAEVSMYHALFLYNQARFTQAQVHFDKCINDATFDKRALCFELAGFNQMRLNNPQKAIASFIKATQINPNMPVSYLSLANLYIQSGENKLGYDAFKQYDQMAIYIESVNHTAQSLWIGIQLASAVGEKSEVLTFANKLNKQFPGSEEVKLYNAWLQN